MGKNKREALSKPEASKLFTIANPVSPISEQYRTIRTNIQFAQQMDEIRSIVVTSSGPSEGKSTTAANLAVVFAQSGAKTLLVDADLRRPTSHLTFDLDNIKGLSSLLSVKRLSLDDVIQRTDMPNLFVLPSGPLSPHPSELLASGRMKKVIRLLKDQYDFIIFDAPPVVNVTDAQVLSTQVDGTIITVREDITDKKMLEKSDSLMKQVGANLLGVVYISKISKQDYQGYYKYEE